MAQKVRTMTTAPQESRRRMLKIPLRPNEPRPEKKIRILARFYRTTNGQRYAVTKPEFEKQVGGSFIYFQDGKSWRPVAKFEIWIQKDEVGMYNLFPIQKSKDPAPEHKGAGFFAMALAEVIPIAKKAKLPITFEVENEELKDYYASFGFEFGPKITKTNRPHHWKGIMPYKKIKGIKLWGRK
jgi:hypothetical protein